jgi:DNA-binding response OmpR family regulator
MWSASTNFHRSVGAATDAAPERAAAPETRPILLIEDDAGMRLMLLLALEDAGYAVQMAEHGEEAQAYLSATRPRLILLDMRMPVMDGPAFLHWLYAQSDIAPPPVILMTAYHELDPETRQLGLPAITKPMRIDALLEMIRQHAEPE